MNARSAASSAGPYCMLSSIWPGWNSPITPSRSSSHCSAASNRSNISPVVSPPMPDAVHAVRRDVAAATKPPAAVGVGLHDVELHLEAELRLVAERAPGLDRAAQCRARARCASGSPLNSRSAMTTSVSTSHPGRRVSGSGTVERSGKPTSAAYPSTGRMSRSMPIVSVVTAWWPCSPSRRSGTYRPCDSPLRSHHITRTRRFPMARVRFRLRRGARCAGPPCRSPTCGEQRPPRRERRPRGSAEQ